MEQQGGMITKNGKPEWEFQAVRQQAHGGDSRLEDSYHKSVRMAKQTELSDVCKPVYHTHCRSQPQMYAALPACRLRESKETKNKR